MIHELEQQAQRAAERRLAEANDVLWEDESGEVSDDGDVMLAGPYCGCDTCVVREVIDAAWPALYRLAHHPETAVPFWPADFALDELAQESEKAGLYSDEVNQTRLRRKGQDDE